MLKKYGCYIELAQKFKEMNLFNIIKKIFNSE